MTTATDIASYINSRVQWGFDNTKLQKLVYLANAWSLAWTAKPLVSNQFEAWKNGPVERDLWTTQRYSSVPPYEGQLTTETTDIVDAILREYGETPATVLVTLCHEHPWEEARAGLPDGASSRTQLRESTIRMYYANLALADKGPKRVAHIEHAQPDAVRTTSRAASARWKEALDTLASR
jgi:uncharacterized phage-associated protein